MTVVDLCEQGIAALLALYGECPAEDYEPDCAACRASVVIREMRALREDEPMPLVEFQRVTCDRCQQTGEAPKTGSAALHYWVLLETRNLSGPGLSGTDLHPLIVLCHDCRKSLAAWMKARDGTKPT